MADTPRRRLGQPALGLLILVALVLAGWALHAMQAVFLPVVFSVLLALLVAPIDSAVTRAAGGRARWLGHMAAMTALALALAAFLGALGISAQQFLVQFPAEEAKQAVEQLSGNADEDSGTGSGPSSDRGSAAGSASDSGDETARAVFDNALNATPGINEAPAGVSAEVARELAGGGGESSGSGGGLLAQIRNLIESGTIGTMLKERASGLAATVLSMLSGLALTLVLIFFLTLLMLIEAPRWRAKLGAVVAPDRCDEVMATTSTIADKLRRYLAVRFVLGLLTAALYSGWLAIFGVDLLLVWALLTFALNFIPSIGSLISGILPVIYVFATRDPWTGFLVGAGLLVIEQVMGNYVDPRMQGRQLSISALVVLVSLLLWGWIWGVAGAILAVPMTMTVMIICAHVPALRPVALALSGEEDFAALGDRVGAPGATGTGG